MGAGAAYLVAALCNRSAVSSRSAQSVLLKLNGLAPFAQKMIGAAMSALCLKFSENCCPKVIATKIYVGLVQQLSRHGQDKGAPALAGG